MQVGIKSKLLTVILLQTIMIHQFYYKNQVVYMQNVDLLLTITFFHSWDEWVPESRVLKLNDQNIQRQKDLQKAHEASV